MIIRDSDLEIANRLKVALMITLRLKNEIATKAVKKSRRPMYDFHVSCAFLTWSNLTCFFFSGTCQAEEKENGAIGRPSGSY